MANPIWAALLADDAVERSLRLPPAIDSDQPGISRTREAVRRRLAAATREERSVAALHHLAGYPLDQIADELDLTHEETALLAGVLAPPPGVSYRPLGDPRRIGVLEPEALRVTGPPPLRRRPRRRTVLTVIGVAVVIALVTIGAALSVGERPSLDPPSSAASGTPTVESTTSTPRSAGCGRAPAPAGVTTASLGSGRTYRLAVPQTAAGVPGGLVVAIPGYGQTAESFEALADLETAGPAAGFTVATLDPVAPGLEVNSAQSPDQPDDASAVTAIIDQVAADHCVDPSQIHLVGFGPGAQLAGLVACQKPGVVASVVAVAGGLISSGCTLEPPVSLFELRTADDAVLPVTGGYGPMVANVAPLGSGYSRPPADGAEAEARHWAELVRAGAPATTAEPDGTTLVQYGGNTPGGPEVRLVITPTGGHTWLPTTTDSLIEFISNHPRRR